MLRESEQAEEQYGYYANTCSSRLGKRVPYYVALGMVLMYPGEGSIDNPIAFARRKLSIVEKTYTTKEREGLAMVYALQKFIHYLLGGHFKMYTNHSALKYLVNKLVVFGGVLPLASPLTGIQF